MGNSSHSDAATEYSILKEWPLHRTVMVLLLILFYIHTPTAAFAAAGPMVQIDLGDLDYHIGPIDKPMTFDRWKPVTAFDSGELSEGRELWLRVRIPDAQWEDPAMLVTAFLEGFAVYLNNVRIYSYGDMATTPQPGFRYHMSHLIPLSGYTPGSTLYINSAYQSRAGMGELISLTVGESRDIHDEVVSERDALYRSSIVDVCLGALLLIVGAGAFFVFFIRLRERDYPFLAFGMFALFAGLTYLSDVNALFFLNLTPATHYYLKSFSFLMVPTGLFAFFCTMFSFKRKASWFADNLWLFHCVLAAAGIAMSYLGIDYMIFFLPLLIINCSLCILIIVRSRDAAAMNIRISFVAFFLLFISLILLHLMASLNLIPFTYDLFGWGLITFVFALGYVLIRQYTSTYHAMQTVSLELEKNKSEMLALQKENLTSQLEALKNQVDPHFLFNSFSTLASIIDEGRDTAASFVQELSSVYRYVLQTRVETLVTVKEELDFIRSYSFLMSSRFGENLSIVIKVPERFHLTRVIPFSLQLLVENAVKHNIISGKKPLSITLFEENGSLVVTNNLQKKATPSSSTRIGLDNIRNRYRLITGKKVRVAETESMFRVEIPLIDGDS